jgi:alpha-galactosidase
VTLNVWEAVYFDHDLDTLLRLAERASQLGVERFVLDDGWFGARRDDTRGLGDWVVSAEVWPDGLHPLVDRVVDLGMQFGLWFEPEMVNPDSDVARAHPEWVMAARREWPVESRHQQVLNLGIPECFDEVLGRILAILDEYPVAYVKWDHNRDLVEAGDQTRDHRPGVHAQTLAFYRMLAAIKKRRPDIEIESCSSGGARVDLGVLEHTDRVWVSDCIDPLERQHMMLWTAQLVPLEMLGSHVASNRSHTTGRMHDLNFRAATAVFGHFGIEWNILEASDRALDELSAWVDFYREHRPLRFGGDLVRMDDTAQETIISAVVARDRSEALVALAHVGYPLAAPGPNMVLRGLDPARSYAVRPVLVGAEPAGLQPPQWWGEPSIPRPHEDGHPVLDVLAPATFPGSTFTGAALEHVGVRPPGLHPDQVVLFHALATGAATTDREEEVMP